MVGWGRMGGWDLCFKLSEAVIATCEWAGRAVTHPQTSGHVTSCDTLQLITQPYCNKDTPFSTHHTLEKRGRYKRCTHLHGNSSHSCIPCIHSISYPAGQLLAVAGQYYKMNVEQQDSLLFTACLLHVNSTMH